MDTKQTDPNAWERLTPYLVAVGATAVVGVVRYLLYAWLADVAPFLPFTLSVSVTAWYGGLRPGLLATVLGGLLSVFLFSAPHLSFRIEHPGEWTGLLLFLVVGITVSWFCEALRSASHRAEEQRERLRTTLASIADAVITTDTAGRITNMNAEAEALTGWKNAEAFGQAFDQVFRIVSETTRQPIDNLVAKVLEQGRATGLDHHAVLLTRDGSERPIEDRAAPIRCKKGEIVGCVLVFRDVTQRRMAETALAERTRLAALRADAATALASENDVRTALQRCCQALVQHLDAAFARIWTCHEADDVLELQASAGRYTHLDGPHSRIRVGDFKIGRIAASRQPHLTNDVAHDPQVSDQTWARRENMVAFAGYPLLVEKRCVGVVALFACRPLSQGILGELAPIADGIAQFVDRKRAEERLLHSERELADFFENSTVGLHWVGPDGIILRANRAELELLGYSPEEYIGHPITEFHADQEVICDILRRLKSGEELHDYEARLRCKDGSIKHVLINSNVLWQEGRFIHTRCFTRDISDRKRAEEALRYQSDLNRTITDNATTAIFMMDNQSRCTFMNPAAEAMTGYSFAEANGQILHDLIHHHHPDGRPYPKPECPIDRALPEQFEVRDHEDLFFRKNGEPFPVLCNARPVHLNGKAMGTVIEVRDISADKQAAEATRRRSEQLRHLAEIATRINTAHDVPSVLNLIAVEARHLIGAHQSVASLSIDQNWAQAIQTVSLSNKYERWRDYDARPDGSGIYSLACRLNRPMRLTQSELEAHPAWRGFGTEAKNHPPLRGWLVAPFIGRDGRNFGLIQLSDKYEGDFTGDDEAILVQLAHMASVAIENARLVADLREADHRKDEFLATLAHELRNPLAPIRNGLHLMRLAGNGGEAVEQARTMMERQLSQLVRLVDDLMDVSRITRGKIELRKDRVQLAAVIHSAVETSRPLIEKMEHILTVTLPSEPIVLEADMTRLAQVFLNLLNNAAKYTERGGRISLSAERHGGEVVVRVQDTGIGIAADQVPRIFEMFSQVDRSLERAQGGLGIGLTLVRRLVEMHGGRVEARSDGPGKGSEFLVHLPVVVAAPQPHSPGGAEEAAAPKTALRILIVDDNRDSAESLAMMLQILGNDIRVAYDGEEAVSASSAFQPDVILLDIGLPKLNGYEACRRIRNQAWSKDVVIIAQTGWGQKEDRQSTAEAGFDYHLVKPIDPKALMNLLTSLHSLRA